MIIYAFENLQEYCGVGRHLPYSGSMFSLTVGVGVLSVLFYPLLHASFV